MTETKYKVKGPVGNFIHKEVMTEEELREFIPTLIQDEDQAETWKEKAKKDPIEDLIELLVQAGYSVTPVK